MQNFLIKYWNRVIKQWWNTIAGVVLVLIGLIREYFGPIFSGWQILEMAILYLFILTIIELYSCYKKLDSGSESFSNLPDSYQDILNEIATKIPNLLEKSRDNAIKAYKQRERNNIDLIIEEHYLFYYPIKDELIKLYKNADPRIVITHDSSRIKREFFGNYSEVERWYNQLHSENWSSPTFPEITQLIDKTNQCLYVLLREIN